MIEHQYPGAARTFVRMARTGLPETRTGFSETITIFSFPQDDSAIIASLRGDKGAFVVDESRSVGDENRFHGNEKDCVSRLQRNHRLE